MKKANRLLSALLVLSIVFGMFPVSAWAANSHVPFTDIEESDWFYHAVQYMYETGLMRGTGDEIFSPNTITTRGMIVTILHCMEGSPTATGKAFTDVHTGQWYSAPIAWASAKGIVSGYENGAFGPNDPVTREQMVAILYRYANFKGYDSTVRANISSFSDASSTSAYALAALQWAVGNSFMSGFEDATLRPQGYTERAQTAAILMRFCENMAQAVISFDYNDSNRGTYKTVSVQFGHTVAVPNEPRRSGYTFEGWYKDASCRKRFDFHTEITGDLTLYAKWDDTSPDHSSDPDDRDEQESFTVMFQSNGGSAVVAQRVPDGERAVQPAAPVRDGFVFDGWFLDAGLTVPYAFTSGITKDITLYARWRQEPAEAPTAVLHIDMNRFSYSHEDGWYVVAEEVHQLSGSLESSGPINCLTLTVKDAKGNAVLSVQAPAAEAWSIPNVGLILGVNTLVVTVDLNGTSITDEVKVFNMTEANMKNLTIDHADTDQDGLTNYWEQYYGTDAAKADTDSDGLSDYYELYTSNTSPLTSDTDGNGIPDGEEDFDGDGLTNLIESQKSGDPYLADTDGDGLSDAEEIQCGTALNLPDTDLDGVSDAMEVNILHTDPLRDEGEGSRAFPYSQRYETSSAVQPTVEITASGSTLETLEIKPVDPKSGFLTSSLPGFIGQGYDITMDGSFSSATVRFAIDEALFSSQNFTPALYYYNEESQCIERVENQHMEGRQVVASLEHFSSYIVLNEAKYVGVMKGGGKYDEIAQTDSDQDGLPDVLENNGIIMQNGLYFYTLANNPDSDGDGLTDGQEISIHVLEDGSWYGILHSNPNLKDSDGDGAADKQERDRGSSPMHSDMETSDVERLLNNDRYASSIFRLEFDQNWLQQFLLLSDSALLGNWNYALIYKRLLLDFFETHAEELYEVQLQGAYSAAIDSMVNWIATANSTTSSTDPDKLASLQDALREAKKIQNRIAKGKASKEELTKVINLCGEIVAQLNENIPADLQLKIGGTGIGTVLSFSGAAFESISHVNEVVQTYARIDANAEVLRDHSDILSYIVRNTGDLNLKAAAQELMLQINLGIKDSFKVRDGLLNITSSLSVDLAMELLSSIKGTAGQVIKTIDAATNWGGLDLSGMNERGVRALGYASCANAVANGMQKDGLTLSSGYTPVTNRGVYNLYVLLFLRQEAEGAWNSARPYRSASKSMQALYEDNIKFLSGVAQKYKSGDYGFSFGNFSAAPRQGICGYVSAPADANLQVYAYHTGRKKPCAMDYTHNGAFFLSLDDGTYDIQVVSAGFEDRLFQDVKVKNSVVSLGTFTMELKGSDSGQEPDAETFDLYAPGADDQFQAVIINGSLLTLLGHTDSREHSYYGIMEQNANASFLCKVEEATGNFGMLNPDMETWRVTDLSYFPDGEHIFYFSYLDDSNGYLYKYSGRPIVIEVEDGSASFVRTESLTYNMRMLGDLDLHPLRDFLVLEEHESVSQNDMQVIREKAAEITAGIPDDYHKAKAIYEWVCEHIMYDSSTSGDPEKQLPQTVLATGKAVCDGYAQITQALLISIDIPCAFITGYSPGNREIYLKDRSSLFHQYANHAWNAAYIDGRWVLLETTWGNQVVNGRILLGDFDTHLDAFTTMHRYDQIGRKVITVGYTAEDLAA